jgi:hypothetical protein
VGGRVFFQVSGPNFIGTYLELQPFGQ